MQNLSVLVYRQEKFEIGPVCMVRADVEEGVTPADLRDRIRAAVTEWAKEGHEWAKQIMDYAGSDFNLGDLTNCVYDEGPLCEALERQGVRNLTIEQLDTQGEWNYDTPLVDDLEEDA